MNIYVNLQDDFVVTPVEFAAVCSVSLTPLVYNH